MENQLNLANSLNEQTMNSLQMSDLTGKNHSHLMRDIRKMEDSWLNVGQSKFGFGSYTDKNNQERPMYELTKTQSLYIATKFNDETRAKLILRWEQLEKEKQFILPKTFSEALKLAANQAEQIEAQNLLIKEQAPKIIAFENVIDNANTYTLDSVSDILDIGRTTLCRLLEKKKWKTIKETHGTSSTRYSEENGFAKTIYEYIKINNKDIKTKRIVLKKKGLEKLIKEFKKNA